jgi:Sigma-54 interaction domain/Bacterial regulatory protein, Fis family
LLDEVDALPLLLQSKLLTALEAKRVRRLGAVMERVVDVKLMAATNAVLPEYVATGQFRADLYHRLAVVVLVLPPLRERGADICRLAKVFLQHYSVAHGIPSKRLSAEAEAWLQDYAWPGNVRELSHVMERVTLLHIGEEVNAKTLMQLCQPLMPPQVSLQTASAPPEAAGVRALPAEAEQIRQALVQSGGNVVQAARLLGMSLDAVRYRMRRYGIARPGPGAESAPASPHTPEARGGGSFHQRQAPPPEPPVPSTPSLAQEGSESPPGSAARQDGRRNATIERHIPTAEPAWEHKPVAVLALELTWPAAFGLESLPYDPWTEMAWWEQAIVDKVHGFGGTLIQRTASLLVWVFGLPRGMEQLPQRAVHSALAVRQMVVETSTPDSPRTQRCASPCIWGPYG